MWNYLANRDPPPFGEPQNTKFAETMHDIFKEWIRRGRQDPAPSRTRVVAPPGSEQLITPDAAPSTPTTQRVMRSATHNSSTTGSGGSAQAVVRASGSSSSSRASGGSTQAVVRTSGSSSSSRGPRVTKVDVDVVLFGQVSGSAVFIHIIVSHAYDSRIFLLTASNSPEPVEAPW